MRVGRLPGGEGEGISAREDARRAWREAVNAAARAWSKADRHRHFRGASIVRSYRDTAGALTHELTFKVYGALEDALSAPKPWRSSRRPDPRRRYSRAHRRGCVRCRVAHQWMHPLILQLVLDLRAHPEWGAGSEWSYVARFERLTRDPHGRRA